MSSKSSKQREGLDFALDGGVGPPLDDAIDDLLRELADFDVADSELETDAAPSLEPSAEVEPGADPVSIYMRQLRQVPLLSRRAEVDAAKRLEGGRLDALCAALETSIARDELGRHLHRVSNREIDLLDPMAAVEAEPRASEDPLELLGQLEQLAAADQTIAQRAGGTTEPAEAERAAELHLRLENRAAMLEVLCKIPFRDAYTRRLVGRLKGLSARFEDAREVVSEVQAETGRPLGELRRLLRARRRGLATEEAAESSIGGIAEAAPTDPAQLRRLENALRRIRALEKRAGASMATIERVHRAVLGAERKMQRAKDELVLANQRLVVHIAGRYVNRGLPFLELVQEGNLGLMRAVDKFDYRRGYKFSTYGTWWIRHAISRAIANQTRTIRLPVHIRDAIRRLVAESQRHVMECGREPTTEELAQRLEIPVGRVVEIMEASRKTLRWELPVGEDGETELGTLISDKEAPTPFEEVSHKGQWEQIVKAMTSLRDREREVMRRRFGLDGRPPQTLEEVGKDLGITRERVRQIQARSIRKIQVAVRMANRVGRIAQVGRRPR